MNEGDARLIRRRNGRLIACNPCRSRKVACDHARPVCSRCRKQKQDSRCIYPEPGPGPAPGSVLAPARRRKRDQGSAGASLDTDEPRSTPLIQSPTSTPLSSHPGPSGFIGFATYSTVVEETQNSLDLLGVSIADDVETDIQARQQPQNISFSDLPRPLQEACLYVLRCLPGQRNQLIKFVNTSATTGGWNNVAIGLIVQSLQQTFNQLLSRGEDGLEAMATILCNNTARPFQNLHDDPREWLGQFCGASLRWESLGLLWANLARVSDIVNALETQSIDWANGTPALDTAAICLGYCIDICLFLTGSNNLLLDLTRRKGTLDSMVSGDETLPCFSTHGVAITMMTFLGIHALQNGPDYVPTLCSEHQRRQFAQIFTSDKLGMVFTGRPPLISNRYCSTPLPLDLRDEDLVADPVSLARAVESLDSNGWNTHGEIYPSTVIRARYLIACVREEIFDIALSKNLAVTMEQLFAIKAKQHAVVEDVPRVLLYQPADCNAPEVDTRTLFLRLFLRLEHLQNLFFINKLILRHGFSDHGDLLVVSYELVALTLKFWIHKDRFGDFHMRRHFEWFSMTYAAPGSGILCQELLHPTFSGVHHKNSQLSRSNMVQQLSLLIGFLDWVPKGAPNWALCVACKRVIQRVLDHHLNGTFANGGMTALEPAHWDYLDQPDFSFELLDTFDWLRPDGQV